MALVFRHPESDYTPQPDKESAVRDYRSSGGGETELYSMGARRLA